MQLLTKIPLKKQPINQIDYASKLLLIGSCFSENIGNKLTYFKFQSAHNPLGNLFHPKAIENLITNAINEKKYIDDDIFSHNERWHSFDAHSNLSSNDKNQLLSNLNNAVEETYQQLKNASHLIITLGTSWVYREISSDKIVANCHKIPQKKFLKKILSVNEISESLEAIIALIKSVNNKAIVLFTVSPVRHLKDGFIENTQSKAHLVAGINQVIDKRDSFYFPSYEIMMDELRDYRFYAEDMIHPNKTAINYIWQRFSDTWITEKASKTMQEVEIIQKGLTHRPFNKNSKQHQQFLKNLQEKKETLLQEFPFMKF
ncbi:MULTISPECIES: GSCFA domain-containing protein [Tenacibaculum]|uniref:GSCFA domain-containing protein n=1 Tax=Tenacibaculum TaxID=104267 RepID=UPI001F0AFE23|nr:MULTISPECIES: GSCFA domain-containing protein [Tenacibaculum]MCH3881042.1 GSCFA domain-containing protein [Tenacibaculum aquimarinum]MDO6599358.1 GSCFA domain-containing protein [Tenacibaculum sp. 1_MG-2023]